MDVGLEFPDKPRMTYSEYYCALKMVEGDRADHMAYKAPHKFLYSKESANHDHKLRFFVFTMLTLFLFFPK